MVAYVDEEELLALKKLAGTDAEEADSMNRAMAADLMALLRRVAELDRAGALSWDDLAWTEDTEGGVTRTAENLEAMAEDILRGAAVLETRPGEDQAVVAELRRKAAQSRARAADARQVVAAARRLQEKEMRRMAALDHLVDPNVMGFLARVAGEMDYYASSSSVEGVAGPAIEEAAGAADRVELEMVTLSLRLRLAATDFAGEEALAAALRRQVDMAEAALAAVEAFRASMRRYQVAAGIAPPPEEEEGSEDDDMMA